MTINEICEACINALQSENYNESTIANYRRMIQRFKLFCKEKQVTIYSSEIGQSYANDVISKATGKFSMNRYKTQGRFYRLIDSYYITGEFDFSHIKRGKVIPDNKHHKLIHKEYQNYLLDKYENDNTRHFYEYGMYCLLQFLNSKNVEDIHQLSIEHVMDYIKSTKPTRQRGMLCELRGILLYLKRDDLYSSIVGIKSPRIKKIIPILSESEIEKIYDVINEGKVTLRDAAIVMVGLSCGIRACDVIKLKLTDIDWNNETIQFRQSKTGNIVCLPLIKQVGNALFRYITEERPKTDDKHLFLRSLAPYGSLVSHATCRNIVRRVFEKAEINKEGRILGMHMLRHNVASTMVKNETPIETIAAILGHASPETTDIYITTDTQRLKECVLSMDFISKEIYHE